MVFVYITYLTLTNNTCADVVPAPFVHLIEIKSPSTNVNELVLSTNVPAAVDAGQLAMSAVSTPFFRIVQVSPAPPAGCELVVAKSNPLNVPAPFILI